ncbi:hypothetical protein DPMN_004358, partial [Dreissena polymorpha]
MSSGNGDGKFAVDPTSGAISVLGSLDYDILQTYSLTVKAADGGSPSKTVTAVVTITVTAVSDEKPTCTTNSFFESITEPGVQNTQAPANEFAPVFPVDITVNLNEDTAVGSDIATHVATDGDSNDTPDGVLTIDPTTGKISLASPFDYEAAQSFVITILATDGGSTPLSGSATVTVTVQDDNDVAPTCSQLLFLLTVPENSVGITITDVNEASPVFNPSSYTNSIAEDAILGASVVTVTATDADTADKVVYSIISGNNDNKFAIDSNTGIIRVAGELNADLSTTMTYTLVVKANEVTTTNSATASVTITVSDVNDNTPKFAQDIYYVAVDEDRTAVGIVTALDSDRGADGEITYTIISGNGDGKFAVDPTSGAISVLGSLDYDIVQTYSLTVRAADGGSPSKTVTAVVTITVTGVSDEKPTCTTHAFFESITEPGVTTAQPYVQLACSDADGETLSYSLASNTGATFAISNTGSITLSS